MKFLVWLAIAFVVLWFLRGKKQHPKSGQQHGKVPGEQAKGEAEAMVQCVHCSVYLPASEAVILSPAEIFCCEAHRKQHV